MRTGRGPTIARTLSLMAGALALAACATALRPAPEAMTAPSWGLGAMGEADGVRVLARPGAWIGYPRQLDGELTVVLVLVQNDGHHRVRLRHQDFALVRPDGRRLAAIPPFEIRGTVGEPVDMAYPALYPPWFFVGHHHFIYNPFWEPFYSYPSVVYVPLPTGDMIQKAMPETVVEPGARIQGFLYLPRLRKEDRGRMTFTADLVDAQTQQPFATVTIPFIAE